LDHWSAREYRIVRYSSSVFNSSIALGYMMREHGLTQSDLPGVGTQSVVSEILSGKRQLNLRQIRWLAERFGVSVETFI